MALSSQDSLFDLASSVVSRARQQGMDVAEASARGGSELSVRVRVGKAELVEEAGYHSLALRVIKGQRVAISSTSDLSTEGVDRLLRDAHELVELSEPDPYAGPADASLLCSPPHPDLALFDPAVAEITADAAIARALACERAALAYDPRITLSEGATFSRSHSEGVIVLSSGFSAGLRGSYASLSMSPVVPDADDKKRRGAYWSAHRHLQKLEAEEYVGQEAARRTLAKLGARKINTTEAPVIFDPDVARSVIGSFAGCVTGGALWRKSSYLLERLGSVVASPLITLVDDPLLPEAPGSRPFDGEGLRSRKNVVVERGELKTFLLDSYSARKLKRESTASASRSGGSVGAATSNFLLLPGDQTPKALISGTERGLYVTDLMGFGFNALTGDYSRGAAGFWIENGQFAFPVSEITISSNLDTMLKNIDAVASDLKLNTSIAAPTFRISQMTISGQ